MRYFLHLGYNGKRYHGWQRQPKVISVQQVVEEALSKMIGETIVVIGCGRTDAGVHASQYFLHFYAPFVFDQPVAGQAGFDAKFRLNKMLPTDIAIFDVLPMEGRVHAQYGPISRTYDYYIHFNKDPFLQDRSSYYPSEEEGFDLLAMKEAVGLLTQYNDYRAFCKQPDLYEHTICEVSVANLWISPNGEKLKFQVTANRFLRGMIRFIVGRLVEIGKGRLTVDQFEHGLKTLEFFKHKNPAYPQGLYLSKVLYPYLDLPSRADFGMGQEAWQEI